MEFLSFASKAANKFYETLLLSLALYFSADDFIQHRRGVAFCLF